MNRTLQITFAVIALFYVALVLLIDTLAMQRVDYLIDWKNLLWHPRDLHRFIWSVVEPWGVSLSSLGWLQYPPARSFDLSKFSFWLVLPFLICIPRMDWAWLGLRRMRSLDWVILAMVASAGVCAISLIPLVPELHLTYPVLKQLPVAARWDYFQGQLFWILSWLIGWEFLHRYVLLRAGLALSPNWGWCLVPLAEVLYHLQKPLPEAGGMLLLSIVLTQWTWRRGTLIPALLAHLIIELELLAYQLL